MEQKKSLPVLVVGAGIAGINAALKLAESGTTVYLCERKPYIGGTLLQLDRWFPDNHCGMCQDLFAFNREVSFQHCFRQGLFHPRIRVLLNSDLEKVEGQAGNFSVTLNIRSTGIKKDLCTGCGLCEQVCPAQSASEFNQGMGNHQAIYLGNPFSLNKVYTIDKKVCTRCGLCVSRCPARAIDLDLADEMLTMEVSSLILATGFEEFDPLPASEFGYKRYPNVITSLELERILSGSGPSAGVLVRPSDGKVPGSIAFLQCIGSRTRQRDYCSATCCMYAIKEAVMLKQSNPGMEIEIHYMDLRDFGKGHYEYHQQAREKFGLKFSRGRVPVVKQDFRSKDLWLSSADENHKIVTRRFDMVVLSVGQTPAPDFRELCRRLGIETNQWGFCATASPGHVETNRRGIYVCGSASGPKDISDTLFESSAAAGLAASQNPIPEDSEAAGPFSGAEIPKAAVLVCNCQKQISTVIDTEKLTAYSRALPGVVHAEEVSALCHPETQKDCQKALKASGANRAILAACSGLQNSEFWNHITGELVDIREQLAWVHQNEGPAATEKAGKMVRMAAEKLITREDSPPTLEAITARALVVGGGLAGLEAALNIASKGFEVDLVEKSAKLGGHAASIYSTLEGDHPAEHVRQLILKAESQPLIHVQLESELAAVSGYPGNFRCILKSPGPATQDLQAGAIIIATGAEELHPEEYLYGQSEQVITQHELEQKISTGDIKPADLKSVAMIQCVGSRCQERPYCSRVCCSQGLKNALALKEQNPGLEVAIFYRDMMSYGFKEEYYTRAREQGVRFYQYDPQKKPEVKADEKGIQLSGIDPVLDEKLLMKPDLVVLSTAIIPSSNAALARVLKTELTPEGFFKEAEAKFRPVDLTREGLFVAGLAHSPRDMAETIAQAGAAAQRAVALLSQGQFKSNRMISLVAERRCSGCELCIKACPYLAREKDLEKGVARVIEHLCQGCGTCVSACPNGAARLKELSSRQVFSMMDAAL